MDEGLAVTLRVVQVFEALDIPYLIGGFLASAYHGVARTTVDSDIVADLQLEQVGAFVRRLGDEFYVSLSAIVDAFQTRGSFNLIHLASLYKVDIFLPKSRLFDQAQWRNRQTVVVDEQTQQAVQVASPEDTILAKLEWYRLGGEQSERQWQDAVGIVAVQGARLDWAYMHGMAQTLGVEDLLQRLQHTAR